MNKTRIRVQIRGAQMKEDFGTDSQKKSVKIRLTVQKLGGKEEFREDLDPDPYPHQFH